MKNRFKLTELPELVTLKITKQPNYEGLKNFPVTYKKLKKITDLILIRSLQLFVEVYSFE